MSDATPSPASPSPASPSPASAPPKKKKKGPSATAKLVFSLGFVAFIFGALELVARVAGIADPFAFGGSRLAYQQIYPPLLRRVKDDKGERFRARDPRLVDRAYPVSSPAGANKGARIYCFGESAVAGLGMSENAAFARALERHLRKLGGDHAQDSVANVGIVALDSRQVLKCVQDVCAHQKPDWVVLHVGNNEFLELHALKFQAAQGKTFAIGLDEFLKNHSALYLGLKNKSIAAKNANLTRDTFQTGALQLSERTLVEKKETHVDMEETGEAIAKHKENLRKACQVAKAAGAKVILMTVATNLEWEGMRDPKDGWVAEACGGPLPEGEAARKAKLESALADLTKKADDKTLGALEHWSALYERAHVKRALGDAKGALADFQLANDQDPHLRRCLSVMNENVRALAYASEQHAHEAIFANTHGELCEGTGTNVFVVHDGVVRTPPLASGCLAGITRALVLELCAAHLIPHEEAALAPVALTECDEAFLTSSVREVLGIAAVDGQRLPTPHGPVTERLVECYQELVATTADP